MFWSAADLRFLSPSQTSAAETLLERLRPSLAILGDPRRPTGAATLLDAQQGLFLAHSDAVQGDTIQARIGDGKFRLHVVNRDARTNLVLLGQDEGTSRLTAPNISLVEIEPALNSKVIVLLANGGLIGSFVGGQKLLVREHKPTVPGYELQFESPQTLIANALVLSADGRLLGTMSGTIARAGNSALVSTRVLADVKGLSRGGIGSGIAPLLPPTQTVGPGNLTVGYIPNLIAMRRTVAGFLSESHRPDYAALGLKIQETQVGVVVKSVVDDSPAGRSRIKVGDVLLAMNDRPILKQYDFIESLLMAHPGDRMTIRIRHDGLEATTEVILARTKS